MNKKGFTLVELLAVLVALGLVIGIGTFSISNVVSRSKVKSEEAFVEFIKDAMDVYISNPMYKKIDEETNAENFEKLSYNTCSKNPDYEYAYIPIEVDDIIVEKEITFENIVDSPYYPLKKSQLINPVNDKNCVRDDDLTNIKVMIYRNSNRSYYYRIEKSLLNDCFEFTIDKNEDGNFTIDKINYISNMEDPGNFTCS